MNTIPTPQKPKPKILIVIGVLWVGGGAEKVAATLGNYLTDKGYQTHLLTFYEYTKKYPYHGIYHSLNELPKKNRILKIFRAPLRIWKIHRYAKKHNIDVVYSFLEEANFYTLLAKLFFNQKLPIIVSVRNNLRRRNWLFRALSKILYPHATAVVAVTRAIEQMLIDDLKLKNTKTIYNPLDLEMIEQKKHDPLPIEYKWLEGRSPLYISIGRLTGQKGQWHLIRAFKKVVENNPNATLVILGEGEYKVKLQALIDDCSLSDNVFLLGNHTNVYQFLNTSDAFVSSSLWEGMPNTMLEALAVGLPIVSTDCVSGPREIIAPEVGIEEKLVYPYKNQIGILTQVPSPQSPIWATPDTTPLTKKEQQLAEAIIATFDDKSTYADNNRAHDFAYKQIMQEWETFINTSCPDFFTT